MKKSIIFYLGYFFASMAVSEGSDATKKMSEDLTLCAKEPAQKSEERHVHFSLAVTVHRVDGTSWIKLHDSLESLMKGELAKNLESESLDAMEEHNEDFQTEPFFRFSKLVAFVKKYTSDVKKNPRRREIFSQWGKKFKKLDPSIRNFILGMAMVAQNLGSGLVDIPMIKKMAHSICNWKDNEMLNFILAEVAVRLGRLDFLQLFVECGAATDVLGQKGRSLLMIAIRRGDEPMVQFLLKRQPSLFISDEKGKTPLDYARKGGVAAIVTSVEAAIMAQDPNYIVSCDAKK
jgi:hypothetical protein